MRKAMVEKDHPQLSLRAQCTLLGINRNRLEPVPSPAWVPEPAVQETSESMKLIHAKDPTMGARQLQRVLARNGHELTRWTVRCMMKYLGIRAIYRRPRTTIPSPENPKYPYLSRKREITQPDEACAIDITYIPWTKGYVYLTAIIDWNTRAVLAWKISNTMDTGFCLDTLCEAMQAAGCAPEILNTDQGSQFTSLEWLSAVESLGRAVSMDGKGRWQDNVFIERFRRSVKHEWILLHEYNTLPQLEALVATWIERCNTWRPHSSLDGKTPWQVYRGVAPILERDEPIAGGASETGCLSAAASSQPVSRMAA
jgi:putative transposase